MDKFIYVFTEVEKDLLLTKDYRLLNHIKNIYIFENKPNTNFNLLDNSKYIIKNTLMF